MRYTALSALALSIVLTACGDQADPEGPAQPDFIVNGTPTGNAYSNVGALLFDFDQNGIINGNDLLCTGSLIAPTVFLTAAHCVSFFPPSANLYVSFSPGLYGNITYAAATGFVFDPLFGHDQANYHDLGLVFIPASASAGITPLNLPPAGFLDQLTAKGKASKLLFVNVGYGSGATPTGPPSFPYDGLRKSSKSEFMALQPTWLGLLMNTSATGEGGDCFGDSGGPKFVDGNTRMIVATVTVGDIPCRATSWDWRLDTPDARAFLGQYVSLP